MYEAYKEYTDKLIKSLIKQAVVVTVAIVLVVLLPGRINGIFDWRMIFLFLLPLWNCLYTLVVFTQRRKMLCELKENNVETKRITVQKMARNDRLTYVGGKFDRGFTYGVLKYKIRDSENEVYHFEDIKGGNKILPKVKSCKAFEGREMEITCTKKTHYIIAVKFDADKDTSFLKREMEGYII